MAGAARDVAVASSAPVSTGFGLGYDALTAGVIMVPMCAGITVAGAAGASAAGAGITAVLTAQVVEAGTGTVPTEHSFELGWWIGAGLAVLGGLLVLAIRPRAAA